MVVENITNKNNEISTSENLWSTRGTIMRGDVFSPSDLTSNTFYTVVKVKGEKVVALNQLGKKVEFKKSDLLSGDSGYMYLRTTNDLDGKFMSSLKDIVKYNKSELIMGILLLIPLTLAFGYLLALLLQSLK